MLTSGLIIFTSPSHSLHKKECEGGGGGGAEPGGLRQPRARHPWVGTGGPGTCLRRCRVEREHPRQKPRHLFGNHGTWTLSQLLLFPHVRYSLTARQAMTEARCSTPPGTTAAPARQGADDISNSIDVNRFFIFFFGRKSWNSHHGIPKSCNSAPSIACGTCIPPISHHFAVFFHIVFKYRRKLPQMGRLMPLNAQPAAGEEGNNAPCVYWDKQ